MQDVSQELISRFDKVCDKLSEFTPKAYEVLVNEYADRNMAATVFFSILIIVCSLILVWMCKYLPKAIINIETSKSEALFLPVAGTSISIVAFSVFIIVSFCNLFTAMQIWMSPNYSLIKDLIGK